MKDLLKVAAGDASGDLLIKNARIVNVFSGEIETGDVMVAKGIIVGVGEYEKAAKTVDADGDYLLPGLIDAHVHIESSHLNPISFGKAALLHGTTTIIADPHEIANVLGLPGLTYMAKAAEKTPLDIFYMAPSAVPATGLETAGAVLDAKDIRYLLAKLGFFGLGEMMNFPGVLMGDDEVLAKLAAAKDMKRPVDGHCPALTGRSLNGYVLAGITTEHEAATAKEAKEKLARGMMILIREGSAAKNLEALLPTVNDGNWPYFAFAADDINCHDLEKGGDILPLLKKAVALGLHPIRSVQMATINPARHYHLDDRGAIAPGRKADLLLVSDLKNFTVKGVYKDGKAVGAYDHPKYREENVLNTVHLFPLDALTFPDPNGKTKARVIQAMPGSLYTAEAIYPLAEIEKRNDIQKVLVIARHGKNRNFAWGFVEGFHLKAGAIASTVAHDSHPLIVVGNRIEEMRCAAEVLAAQGGGMAAVKDGKLLASLPLPIAGLMTDAEPKEVAALEAALLSAAKELGCPLPSPFMTLSFLALPVIPKLKISDRGLVDVEKFTFTSLYLD